MIFAYLVVGLVLQPIKIAEASFEEELFSLKKRSKCNYDIFASLDQFRWIHGQWLAPGAPWGIADNFRKLQQQNIHRYNKISEIVDFSFNVPDDFYGLKNHVRELDAVQSGSSRLINDIRAMNYQFEFALNDLESAIISLQREVSFLAVNCDSYKDALSEPLKISKLWQDDIMLYRRFIEKQRVRIENLYLVALEAARTHAFTRYIDKTNEKIDEVVAKLEAALELDRQYGIYIKWWSDLTSNYLIGHGLHTKNLQYRRPLQVMKGQIVELRDHYNRIARLNANPTQKRVLNEIKFSISIVQAQIDELTAKGWKGQWERQKLLNYHRKIRFAPNNPRCYKALNQYEKYASKISNEAEFAIAEFYYREVLKGCSIKPE